MNSFEESLKVNGVVGKVNPNIDAQTGAQKPQNKIVQGNIKMQAKRAVMEAIKGLSADTPQDIVYMKNLENLLPDIVSNFDSYAPMFQTPQNHGIPTVEERQKKPLN